MEPAPPKKHRQAREHEWHCLGVVVDVVFPADPYPEIFFSYHLANTHTICLMYRDIRLCVLLLMQARHIFGRLGFAFNALSYANSCDDFFIFCS